jgi:hypothetical protein
MEDGMNTMLTRRVALSLALALLALCEIGAGRWVPAANAAGQTLDLNLGFGGNYDDNLLQYSPHQRDVFKAGTHPERYSIQSLDDFTMNPTVGLVWTANEGRGRRHVVRARFTGDFQGTNHTADYHEISAGLREVFPHGRSFALGYYSLPGFYLRQLTAEDYTPPIGVTNYTRAQFDLSIGSASWTQAINPHTEFELAYQLEHRSYVPDFKERTSDTHQGKLSLQFSGERPGTDVSLIGGYRVSKAKASDGDEVAGVADDEDVSYKGPIVGLEGRAEFSRVKNTRWSGDASYQFASRKYDSNRAFDVYHDGRNDNIHTFEAGVRCGVRPHWSARGWFKYEKSDAKLGSGAPATSVVGSYTQSQVGLSVEWTGEIWRAHAGAGEPGKP